jgi:hypothetical protein
VVEQMNSLFAELFPVQQRESPLKTSAEIYTAIETGTTR